MPSRVAGVSPAFGNAVAGGDASGDSANAMRNANPALYPFPLP